MKRIVYGKRYDTETATEVASTSWGNRGDFEHFEESLYRTPRGNWFAAGWGGPRSRYAEQVEQNTWSGGQGLRPLTEPEAKEWLEEHGKTEELEQHFGTEVEDA